MNFEKFVENTSNEDDKESTLKRLLRESDERIASEGTVSPRFVGDIEGNLQDFGEKTRVEKKPDPQINKVRFVGDEEGNLIDTKKS